MLMLTGIPLDRVSHDLCELCTIPSLMLDDTTPQLYVGRHQRVLMVLMTEYHVMYWPRWRKYQLVWTTTELTEVQYRRCLLLLVLSTEGCGRYDGMQQLA